MKKVKWILPATLLIIALIDSNYSCASFVVKPKPIAPLYRINEYSGTAVFVKLSAKEYSLLTGKKMSFSEKIAFKLLQLKMKHALKKNPSLNVNEYLTKPKKLGTGWWILIGVLSALVLAFIIFAIAYGAGVKK